MLKFSLEFTRVDFSNPNIFQAFKFKDTAQWRKVIMYLTTNKYKCVIVIMIRL